MKRVSFVFTNPGHHTEMMVPVAQSVAKAGAGVELVSIAELRGLRTRPVVDDVKITRAFPPFRSSPNTRLGVGDGASSSGSFARRALWTVALKPRLWTLLRSSDVVVVPNDAAYPYRALVAWCKRAGKRVVLIQEGIRFPLPNETGAETYGCGGAHRICVWGAAAAKHFERLGVDPRAIVVTGNPRLDSVDVSAWRQRGLEFLRRLGLQRAPILFLSNPIDDQGFCSTDVKLELFRSFVRRIRPMLEQADRSLLVKLHAREDPAAIRAALQQANAGSRVAVVEQEPFFSVLGAGHSAVVWASTAGLEALLFGLPLGVLPLPDHSYAFEYVRESAAHAIDDTDASLAPLIEGRHARRAEDFTNDYVANRGRAAAAIRDVILAST